MVRGKFKTAGSESKEKSIGIFEFTCPFDNIDPKAQQLKKQGQPEQSLKLLEAARLLSPDFPDVYFARAHFLFTQNFTDFYKISRELWRGILLKYADIFVLLTYTNNSLAVLLFAGTLTSFLFVLFSFMYYRRAMFYQLKAVFPFELPTIIGHVLGWILFVVMTLGLGVLAGVLFIILLLIWQVDFSSKRMLRIVLFFGAMLGGFLLLVCITFYAFNGEYFQALRDISRGEYTSRTVNVLQKYLQDHPDDSYSLLG